VLAEDGIPIVYVPRAEIVRAILEADDYDSRIKVLVTNRHDVADDCRAAINQKPLHPLVSGRRKPPTLRALRDRPR
jgi:hypothetical protein